AAGSHRLRQTRIPPHHSHDDRCQLGAAADGVERDSELWLGTDTGIPTQGFSEWVGWEQRFFITSASQYRRLLRRALPREFRSQAGLSDARLTREEDQVTTSDTCLIPGASHLRHFCIAPDERSRIGQSADQRRRQRATGTQDRTRTLATEK